MYIAFPSCYMSTSLPGWVEQAIAEREDLDQQARKFQEKERCSIMEAESQIGCICECDLCHALVLNGIGESSFPNSLEPLNFIILGGAITVLNDGHRPYPRSPGFYDGLDLFDGAYELFIQSLPDKPEDCPLHPHLVAALLRLFKTEHGGGHYQEGTVQSLFISFCISWQYWDDMFSDWANIKQRLLKLRGGAALDLPESVRDDFWKIVDAIPLVLSDVANPPVFRPAAR